MIESGLVNPCQDSTATMKSRSARKAKSEIIAVVDTREQCPLDLEGLVVEHRALPWGDYSLAGLEKIVAIERKSLDDFTACVGTCRERFEREILALRGYPYKAVVCEFNLDVILRHEYQSQVYVASVIGSLERWMQMGIPFIMAGDHATAGIIVAGILKKIAKDNAVGLELYRKNLEERFWMEEK